MKKICSNGFSLLEFMIYLIAFSCIITMALQALVVVVQKARSQSLNVRTSVQLFTALDVISFEIAQAPSKKNKWHKVEKSLCIWHSNFHKKDIGFCFIDKKIIKICGVYSPANNSWVSKVSNTLVENIDTCLFEYEYAKQESFDQIIAVVCSLSAKPCNSTRKISLNNGYRL